jgi:UDP-2-acetamido-2,6-beta-L-arabino-hexul-4-ose reductase
MTRDRSNVAVTGAKGFLGSNLVCRLNEQGYDVLAISRETDRAEASARLAAADVVFHVAGANRCDDDDDYFRSNRDYSAWLASAIESGGRKPLLVYSSSVKAIERSDYGRSKRAGEDALLDLAARNGALVSIWRLPNLCGKWSRPNYNSVVATFCHNAAHGLPLQIDDPSAVLPLLYIDDLMDQWLELIANPPLTSGFAEAANIYRITVGELAQMIGGFVGERERGEVSDVAAGLRRALYSSFVSALPIAQATRPLAAHKDARGTFVEFLRTESSGQFSCFTAVPGATRGGHYHHTKVEKFLVAHGKGRFRFRHVLTGEDFELVSSADEPSIIETIPGWAHDVTNVGNDDLVVLSWANERFDPERPDTYSMPL